MYNKIPDAYSYNPLSESNTKQISFLFGRLLHFLEEADRHRSNQDYSTFAFFNERAISLIHGLSSFLESELPEVISAEWNHFFVLLLQHLSLHTIEQNPTTFTRICTSLRDIELLWKNADMLNQKITIPTTSHDIHESEINVPELTDSIGSSDIQANHLLENLNISI